MWDMLVTRLKYHVNLWIVMKELVKIPMVILTVYVVVNLVTLALSVNTALMTV
jgi:hypothetical protein